MEIRRLAVELAEQLPDWSSTIDPSVNLDYSSLKAAAIKMASAPECVQRAVIEAYPLVYTSYRSDPPNASGMFLLMRVLFVLPADDPRSTTVASAWLQPVHDEANRTKAWNYQWPVRVNPHERVLEIERCQGTRRGVPGWYGAKAEFHFFKSGARFPMRSPAEIEALEIRGRA
jgi:hypothetical protein